MSSLFLSTYSKFSIVNGFYITFIIEKQYLWTKIHLKWFKFVSNCIMFLIILNWYVSQSPKMTSRWAIPKYLYPSSCIVTYTGICIYPMISFWPIECCRSDDVWLQSQINKKLPLEPLGTLVLGTVPCKTLFFVTQLPCSKKPRPHGVPSVGSGW